MKAIRNSVLATVLAGLLVPAGIAIAVGSVRNAFLRDTPAAQQPAAPDSDTGSDAGDPDDKPVDPKPELEPEPKPGKDVTPPSLLLFSPEKGARVTDPLVTVKGAAETGSTVKVNGERTALDDRGRFAREVKLQPGRNVIVIKAYDTAGNRSAIEAAVYFDAPVDDPKPTPSFEAKPDPDIKDFTVHQKFGSSSQDPPFDIFSGTGTPGSTVKVKSEYGYVYTVIGDDGTWEATLIFEGLPPGTTIPIWIKLDGVIVEEFHFTFAA